MGNYKGNEENSKGPASRHEQIAVAAYYNAEQRGFSSGSELDDWLEAEKRMAEQHRVSEEGLTRLPYGQGVSCRSGN
jgi:hypothetical protein